MAKHGAADVAILLREFGKRLALEEGNPYRAKAYATAAESLEALTEPLAELVKANTLDAIPGVGDALAAVIAELHKSGSHPKLTELREKLPAGLIKIAEIPGLRPEQALKVYHDAKIENIKALEKALREGKLNGMKGFTPAFQTKILQGIEIRQQGDGKVHIHKAHNVLEAAKRKLESIHPELMQITPAGEVRRKCELADELILVAIATNKPKKKIILKKKIKLEICKDDNFGSTLLFATGSTDHINELQEVAKAKGCVLAKNGLKKGKKIVASKTEAEIYKALGLQYVEPELREGRNEVELAKRNKLPKLVSAEDIKGILHAHTTSSDGIHSLKEMADAVKSAGFEYFGLSDHSQSAHYAGGLLPGKIKEQQKEVDQLNKSYGSKFKIFKGIESDIKTDGALDYPDDILATFDFIVASVHNNFKLSKGQQTNRIICAVRSPYTTILGHMTGRQLLKRHGYEVDVEAILTACAEHNVAVEINANPWRLDFDWRWHQRALELGCTICINPDAHSTGEIELMQWGIAMARKGGVPAERILNCLSRADFEKYLKLKKSSH